MALGKPQPQVDARIRALIWQDHDEARPAAGLAYEKWLEETAAKYGVPVTQVRRVITTESQAVEFAIRQQHQTLAQQIAPLSGLTIAKVFETIVEGLDATRSEVIYSNKEPKMKVTEDGELVYDLFTQPDALARNRSAELAVKVLGLTAPEQVEMQVNGRVELVHLSPEEFERRSLKFAAIFSALSAGTAGVLGATGGKASKALPPGSVSVVDDGNLHGGRARGRSAKEVQAISDEPPVHTAVDASPGE